MSDIKLACMSLMWGACHLPADDAPAWLDDVKEAGYTGAAVFENELLRFTSELNPPMLLGDRGLSLVSVNYSIDRNTDRLRAICEIMHARIEALGRVFNRLQPE